jgi:hypothetical protein
MPFEGEPTIVTTPSASRARRRYHVYSLLACIALLGGLCLALLAHDWADTASRELRTKQWFMMQCNNLYHSEPFLDVSGNTVREVAFECPDKTGWRENIETNLALQPTVTVWQERSTGLHVIHATASDSPPIGNAGGLWFWGIMAVAALAFGFLRLLAGPEPEW